MARHGRGFVYKAIVLGAVALAPVVEEHVEIVRPRVTAGEQPPVPAGHVIRWSGRPVTVVTFNQNIGHRVVQGEGPILPGSNVQRDDLDHTGAEPVVVVGLSLSRIVAGTDPPVPGARTLHWGPSHKVVITPIDPLPITISGVKFPNENYYCGPFLSDGAIYVVFIDLTDGSLIEVHKATASFTEQDSANKPDLAGNIISMWAYQDGTDLHIAHQTSGGVGYSVFHMSTDLWDGTIIDEEVANPAGTLPRKDVSIAVRPDGDVIVLYQGATDDVGGERQRVDYARREGGTWTFGIAVDNGGAVDWFGAVVVRGSDGRMHFCFKDDTNNDAFQRTLTAANVLETFPSAGDATVEIFDHVFGSGISYNDGGTQRVRVPYMDASRQVNYAEFDSVDAPGAFTPRVNVSDQDVEVRNSTGVMSLAVDGTDEHLLWARVSTFGIFHIKNDGSNLNIVVGTIGRVSSNSYNRNGRKLAYVYLDGSTVKYNELDIDDQNIHTRFHRNARQEVF